ncbi:glycosyltransferase family 4 protein, partial [Candidatus Fermentibacteria bacterium]|nr:glycosyltransferase family 4 protein [Candidatus Fermentibacteria bacterium]
VRGTDFLTDRWIGVSHSLCRSLGTGRRVTYIPNGIDIDMAAEEGEDELPGEAGPVVLCMGRLSREKGQDILLEAMVRVVERVSGAVAWLAGEGPTEAQLRAQSRRLGIGDSVRFLGFREHVAPLLKKSSVVVLPSRGEGLPIAALEAMSAGVPVVAASVGGVPDLLSTDEVGLTVPPEDPQRLGDALTDLLGDPPRAHRIGAAGRAHVEANFSSDRMAERTAEVYRSVWEE